ncbi:hypothetical protein SGGMMB4_04227 [Sodalis glossinidius str. 'morsitans']|uniref:DUF1640 domain-containing protein n=1 Tax=Sodalis glossinidius (strain morsitans) TaxID=343509 RepID=A0A193QLH4_SODGM|nr:hypothetical protein [Sodalis glossinidius]CRL46017.1 hypothetical protein SGGMMB4_04227 [Sodalis glossinidius str. 'morsitans']
MGQVTFDTQEFVETLEKSGLKKEQAKAISIAVRKSHEVADVATKRDLEDVRKDMAARFEKVDTKIDSQISLVRKDLQLEMAGIRSEQKLIRWMLSALIAGVASLIIKAFFVASV